MQKAIGFTDYRRQMIRDLDLYNKCFDAIDRISAALR
jgi:hypothetical protein